MSNVVTKGSRIKEDGDEYLEGDVYKGKHTKMHIANGSIEAEAIQKAKNELNGPKGKKATAERKRAAKDAAKKVKERKAKKDAAKKAAATNS